uniref:Secreted protein n=1 Tax=Steinernema glaseri TaxID=37863 RepID=A0A1I7Y723_9BILA
MSPRLIINITMLLLAILIRTMYRLQPSLNIRLYPQFPQKSFPCPLLHFHPSADPPSLLPWWLQAAQP